MGKDRKPDGYWKVKENVVEEAKKYTTRNDFKKGCQTAYYSALNNGWINSFDWLVSRFKPRDYWTKERVFEAARKCATKKEFYENYKTAHNIAYKCGWIKEMDWFECNRKPNGYWTADTVELVSHECSSIVDFREKYPTAYNTAKKNGWINSYTWLNRLRVENHHWDDYETNRNEAIKYSSRSDFQKKCGQAYRVARINGWLDTYTFFEKNDPYNNENVYAYFFDDSKTVYIGLTVHPHKRHIEHNIQDTAVHRFVTENGLDIPEMTVLESGLSRIDAQEREGFYVKKYTEEGWTILNKAKTGKGCGSLGKVHRKWTYKTVMEESKKYNTRSEFMNGSNGAYGVAVKNKWLDDFYWLVSPQKPKKYWTKERTAEEAAKYDKRSLFAKYSKSAYAVAVKNKWLDDFFPKKSA